MPSIIIIGSGPAGISAALYAVRAGVDTTVLTKGPGALDRAEKIENYYGFAEPVSGAELERRSIENAKRLGVRFVTAEAVGLTYTDKLTVETMDKNYPADAVILATGASRAVPRIPGLAGLEGHGVSYCAACDAFFYRGKDVAVLGSGEYALHEVQALLPVVRSVTLLTNGAPLTADFPPEVTVYPQAVEAVLGETVVTGVQLSGGVQLPVSGVFVALGVAGSTALARKIGAEVDGNRIVVDEKMQTTVPGLYAAGDVSLVARAHLSGAFTFGQITAENATEYASTLPDMPLDEEQVLEVIRDRDAKLAQADGKKPIEEFEYKVRRLINDYIRPPKNEYKLDRALWWMDRFKKELRTDVRIANKHDLFKAYEVENIIHCAAMSALASKERKESRWGLWHMRSDYPMKDDEHWMKHIVLKQGDSFDDIRISYAPIIKM